VCQPPEKKGEGCDDSVSVVMFPITDPMTPNNLQKFLKIKKKCVFLGSEQTRTNGSNMCSRVESVREKNVKQIFVLYPETLDVLLPRFRKIRKKEYKNV
jgi:hypothetical protein